MSDRTGGCLCGKVRYQAEGAPIWVAHCHCKSRRKASDPPIVTWTRYRPFTVTWTDGVAKPFASFPGVLRCYCPDCGKPLSYEITRWPGELHIPVAKLEDLESVTLPAHTNWPEQLA